MKMNKISAEDICDAVSQGNKHFDIIKTCPKSITTITGLSQSGKSYSSALISLDYLKQNKNVIYFDLETPRYKTNVLVTDGLLSTYEKQLNIIEVNPSTNQKDNFNTYLEKEITALITKIKPALIVFDGLVTIFGNIDHRIRSHNIRKAYITIKDLSLKYDFAVVITVSAFTTRYNFEQTDTRKVTPIPAGGNSILSLSDNIYLLTKLTHPEFKKITEEFKEEPNMESVKQKNINLFRLASDMKWDTEGLMMICQENHIASLKNIIRW